MALFRFGSQFSPASFNVPIYIDDVLCNGEELRLDDCISDTDTTDCIHFFHDVGVQCTGIWQGVVVKGMCVDVVGIKVLYTATKHQREVERN